MPLVQAERSVEVVECGESGWTQGVQDLVLLNQIRLVLNSAAKFENGRLKRDTRLFGMLLV
jgi:hypothetical protein